MVFVTDAEYICVDMVVSALMVHEAVVLVGIVLVEAEVLVLSVAEAEVTEGAVVDASFAGVDEVAVIVFNNS